MPLSFVLPENFWAPVKAPDAAARAAALARQAELTKPAGSLGRLESIAVDFAGWQGRDKPMLQQIRVRVFAADHGVAGQGVSAFPQAVTAQMIANFCSGGAAIAVLSRELQADFRVVNLGCVAPVAGHPAIVNATIAAGTRDFTQGPAMTKSELMQALAAGAAQVADGRLDVFVGGEMGIGNTTAASALLAALMNCPAADITGRGTGINDAVLAHKTAVIEQALLLHDARKCEPQALLQCLGGFEIAALSGAYIAAARRGVPSLVDGFISTAAAAIAVALVPSVREWLLFSHCSAETGHSHVLQWLKAEPLLSLGLRLGEGSGAAVALHTVKAALTLHASMATFAEAGVSNG